jgi:anhydro-N-acetylmuramic acid kinase
MSGTSCDGLDMAAVDIWKNEEGLHYKLLAHETMQYSEEYKTMLQKCFTMNAMEFCKWDAAYGAFIGKSCLEFIFKNKLDISLIVSHGHTVFHQPHAGFSCQIGNGATIAAVTGIPVVNDLRSMDVALGGQGAPLVPIGDKMLFGNYDFCLNLGGIANISFDNNEHKRIAFDICPANMALNTIVKKAYPHLEYDENGTLAASGHINENLFLQLNNLNFFKQPYPKSLGFEWFSLQVMPMLDAATILPQDILCTLCHHIALQIKNSLALNAIDVNKNMLVTGGGAKNSFLMTLLKETLPLKIVLPNDALIDFKEAIIFALLGYLRVCNCYNALSTVTGAAKDSIGGSLYGDFSQLIKQ